MAALVSRVAQRKVIAWKRRRKEKELRVRLEASECHIEQAQAARAPHKYVGVAPHAQLSNAAKALP